ncbi:MAG: hypothetical protein V7607_3868 [Solirubrobacteraceae bacterium]
MSSSLTSSDVAALVAQQRVTNELLRVLVRPQLRQDVLAVVGTTAERKGFDATDGTRSVRAVAGETGVSPAAVGKWWKKWRAAGLASEDEHGRVRHVMSLSALGIDLKTGS